MTQIPKIVGQRLGAVAALGEHPDPNLLSAFVERSLGRRERVEILEHLSQCMNCREIVSLTATQPAIADAVSLVRARPSWPSWPVLGWGAAVACVMVVGAAVTLHQRQESQPRTSAIANGPPAAAGTLTPNVAVDNTLASLQAPKSDTKIVSKPAASRRRISTANSADGNGAGPFEIADARPVSPFADVVPGRAKEAFAESQGAQAEPAIGDDALFVENFIPRWTLSSDGTLQRSLDSGRTWQTIAVSSQTIFRVLAANGMDIWVGGAAGALFHSSDAGQHWTQVRPVVNGEALADDIIGVEFTDAVHGKLTSSVQEIWITADAGQTWQKQ